MKPKQSNASLKLFEIKYNLLELGEELDSKFTLWKGTRSKEKVKIF